MIKDKIATLITSAGAVSGTYGPQIASNALLKFQV